MTDGQKRVEFENDRRWQVRRAWCAVVLTVWVGAGCASMTKHDWLRIFFDGVPDENNATATNALPSVAVSTNQTGPLPSTQPRPPSRCIHAPYADNKCAACHVVKFSQRIAKKPIELCFSCHTNFLVQAKVKHAPAEQGECLSCHHPHQSDNKFLLLRKGKALCLECHEDVTAGKVKHAPAADGACLDCHRAHVAEGPFLLIKQGTALCYECHDQTEVAKQTAHAKLGEKKCIECHDPHSAKFKALLKKEPSPQGVPDKPVLPPK